MKILFDNGTPKPIARSLTGHEVAFARQIGWHELGNGELIQQAEDSGYDVLLSTDKNILVILGNPQWPLVQLHLERIVSAVNACTAGSYIEVEIPFE
jgi:hypothetical protein